MKRSEDSIRDLSDTIKWVKALTIRVPEREEKETEILFLKNDDKKNS